MVHKNIKSQKLFCVQKGNWYIAWDGKTLTEKPHEGIRVSRTIAERKYPEFVMITFPEAYNQWYQAQQRIRQEVEL